MARRLIFATLLTANLASGQLQAQSYLDAALAAARWLESHAVPTKSGLAWPVDPEQPERTATNLYSGSAGVVLYFLHLSQATGSESYLKTGLAGADHLLAALPETLQPGQAGLYTGVAGLGTTLLEAYRISGEKRFLEGVYRTVELLAEGARKQEVGIAWNPVTDIVSGSSGTGLFLLRVARELNHRGALRLAEQAGEHLGHMALEAGSGLRWRMAQDYERFMPNFSHGTAGVAYFLASLYQQTHRQHFLDQALAGGRFLLSIANKQGDGCLILHHEPGGEELYYLSWCHGPVGTARLFYRLWEITGDSEWRQWLTRSAQSIVVSNVPAERTPGFWNNVGQCCGSAGVAEFFLDLYHWSGDAQYLEFSRRMIEDILGRSSREGGGLKWIHAEHRVQPENVAARTGFMQGAAGIGLLLLHWETTRLGRPKPLRLPDSPF